MERDSRVHVRAGELEDVADGLLEHHDDGHLDEEVGQTSAGVTLGRDSPTISTPAPPDPENTSTLPPPASICLRSERNRQGDRLSCRVTEADRG